MVILNQIVIQRKMGQSKKLFEELTFNVINLFPDEPETSFEDDEESFRQWVDEQWELELMDKEY
jgi:hypothetical protein